MKKIVIIKSLVFFCLVFSASAADKCKQNVENLTKTLNGLIADNKRPILVFVSKSGSGYRVSGSANLPTLKKIGEEIKKLADADPKRFLVVLVLAQEGDKSFMSDLDKELSPKIADFCMIEQTQ